MHLSVFFVLLRVDRIVASPSNRLSISLRIERDGGVLLYPIQLDLDEIIIERFDRSHLLALSLRLRSDRQPPRRDGRSSSRRREAISTGGVDRRL